MAKRRKEGLKLEDVLGNEVILKAFLSAVVAIVLFVLKILIVTIVLALLLYFIYWVWAYSGRPVMIQSFLTIATGALMIVATFALYGLFF